ncbi:hypothetical protein J4E90_006679 [Alternaria incomplexa]|uniref:uncharacterized protein n=1 Tax=Alternaria incomplexa TaxID=1187928 RepID=UPI00221F249A|nr:uncharacterized protein J4E90_006679 [Alternaria incomplexa]KAI4911862.1 hypothetical protein J4E90_006679 [Alternaria incomplexa]
MTRHVWRAADASVMLWEPAVAATTPLAPQEPHNSKQLQAVTEADIQASLTSNYDDSEQDSVLPSIEGVFEPSGYTKSEPGEDISAVVSSTVGTSASDISMQRCSSYDSQATIPVSTPCPSDEERDLPAVLRSPARTSHHFNVGNTVPTPQVRRTLDFGMPAFRHTNDIVQQVSEPSDFTSLAALRRLERDPPHHWDEKERELLTILYRWYEDTNVATIPKVFNAITDQNLRLNVIRYQFESHLILYGGRAYPEFNRVMKVPFPDPEHKYDEIHTIIEETAYDSGIDLSRRTNEVCYTSGLARTAKSPKTRKHYKSLVRRALKREKEKARALRRPAPEDLPLQALQLGGTTLAEQDNEETWSDVDGYHTPPITPTQSAPRAPPGRNMIGFRVWDANSRTMFDDETGFVSQAFSIWRGEFPPPFSPDGQGQQALMLLTNLHLSMSGGASAFVSVSTSLLQALVKASTMFEPRIAVIALDHPLLTEPHKTLPAADVMRMLKAEGQAWWARYKGHAERMVWASVSPAAVLSHFPLSDLTVLSRHNQACDDILNLRDIQSGRKTQYVSSLLRQRNTVVNIRTARAMAVVCRAFKMHRVGVSLAHIQGLVSSLVDSFQLKQGTSDTPHMSGLIAKAFAVSLVSQAHRTHDVEAAFQEGIQQGTVSNIRVQTVLKHSMTPYIDF